MVHDGDGHLICHLAGKSISRGLCEVELSKLEEALIELAAILSGLFLHVFNVQDCLGGDLHIVMLINNIPAVLQLGGVLN